MYTHAARAAAALVFVLAAALAAWMLPACGNAVRPASPAQADPAAPVVSETRTDGAARAAGPTACKDRRSWGSYLKQDRDHTIDDVIAAVGRAGVALTPAQTGAVRGELKDVVKWHLIRFLLLDGDNHNFGAVALTGLTTEDGAPVRLFRTGFTPRPDAPDSCFAGLLAAGVRHVVSLYAGAMPTQDLEAAERAAAERAGASYFTARDAPPAMSTWRHDIDEHGDDPEVVRGAMSSVATLINTQILRPGGRAPRGDIHLHCGGGMHRTGMIVGILQKCVEGASMADIEADYKRHVDWRGPDQPGGYEPGNLAFIRDFDCALLTR